jgi:hypothetical protein
MAALLIGTQTDAAQPNVKSKLWVVPWFEVCTILTRGTETRICKEKSVAVVMNPNAVAANAQVFAFKKTGELLNRTAFPAIPPGGNQSYTVSAGGDVTGLSDAERRALVLSLTPAWLLVISDQDVLPSVAFYGDNRGFQQVAYPVDCSDASGYAFVCEAYKQHLPEIYGPPN